jgi:hypothetical protein
MVRAPIKTKAAMVFMKGLVFIVFFDPYLDAISKVCWEGNPSRPYRSYRRAIKGDVHSFCVAADSHNGALPTAFLRIAAIMTRKGYASWHRPAEWTGGERDLPFLDTA